MSMHTASLRKSSEADELLRRAEPEAAERITAILQGEGRMISPTIPPSPPPDPTPTPSPPSAPPTPGTTPPQACTPLYCRQKNHHN